MKLAGYQFPCIIHAPTLTEAIMVKIVRIIMEFLRYAVSSLAEIQISGHSFVVICSSYHCLHSGVFLPVASCSAI